MNEVKIFEPNHDIVRDFQKEGMSILNAAKVFGGTTEKLFRFIKQGRQLPSHGTADLYSAYRTVQIFNRAMDREAGKRLAAEVKRWQAAKVRVPGFHEPEQKPLLESNKGLDELFSKIHAWFDE